MVRGPVVESRKLEMTVQTGDGAAQALRDVSPAIGQGGSARFCTPFGCGRPTFLRFVAALAPPPG